MTAFMSWFAPEQVMIAMDSLCITPEDKLAGDGSHFSTFATKIFPLPDLKGVLCGVGDNRIVSEWLCCVLDDVVARSMIGVDKVATEKLREIAAKNPTANTTEIRHFFFDEEQRRFRCFVYNSEENYQTKESPYGLIIQPRPFEEIEETMKFARSCNDPATARLDTMEGIREFFVKLMTAVKEHEDKKGPDKCNIGGEVHICGLYPDMTFLWSCHRFDDYDSMYLHMLENLLKTQRSLKTQAQAEGERIARHQTKEYFAAAVGSYQPAGHSNKIDIQYSPQVHLSGADADQAEKFEAMLRSHARELADMVLRELDDMIMDEDLGQ